MSSLKKSCKEDVKIMNSKINTKFDAEHVCVFKNVSLKKKNKYPKLFSVISNECRAMHESRFRSLEFHMFIYCTHALKLTLDIHFIQFSYMSYTSYALNLSMVMLKHVYKHSMTQYTRFCVSKS